MGTDRLTLLMPTSPRLDEAARTADLNPVDEGETVRKIAGDLLVDHALRHIDLVSPGKNAYQNLRPDPPRQESLGGTASTERRGRGFDRHS